MSTEDARTVTEDARTVASFLRMSTEDMEDTTIRAADVDRGRADGHRGRGAEDRARSAWRTMRNRPAGPCCTQATGQGRTLGAEEGYGFLDTAWSAPAAKPLTDALAALAPAHEGP